MTIRPVFVVHEVIVLVLSDEREERHWAVYYGDRIVSIQQDESEARIIAAALNHAAPPASEER